MRKRNISFVIVGVLVSVFWLVSPITAGITSEKPKDFTAWMLSLDEETRVKVERVFDENLGCLKDGEEGSKPDYNAGIEKIHRDLQSVLTPAQFKVFTELWSGKSPGERLDATRATCGSCGSALLKLNGAYSNISSALSPVYYKPGTYCDFGPYPDNVYGCMIAAQYRINMASQKAAAAYSTCNCISAQDALYQAQNAKRFLECAIFNTNRYCSSNSPWLDHLYAAQTWLNLAISKLSQCVNEACN